MSRNTAAYLFDALQSLDGIDLAARGLDFSAYQANRVARMAVEREFIIIGEAMLVLSRFGGDGHATGCRELRSVCTPDDS